MNRPPFRPRPKTGESLKGYLLRLAKENFFFTINIIFKLVGLKVSNTVFDPNNTKFAEFISKLAPILYLDEKELLSIFRSSHALDVSSTRMVKNILSTYPKICIDCMKEADAVIEHSWQKIHHTHCNKHATKLVDACPSCDAELIWHADIFDGCPKCGLRWESLAPQETVTIPVYQLHEARLSSKSLAQYTDALYLAALCVYSPGKFILEPEVKLPIKRSDAADMFEKAFHLLRSRQHRHQMVTQLQEKLVSGLDVIPLKVIQKHEHPLSTINYNTNEAVSSNNSPLIANDGLYSDVQAGKIIGISAGELNELSKSNLVKSQQFKLSFTYQLRELNTLLSTILSRSTVRAGVTKEELIPLSSLGKVAHKFLFNFGDAMVLLLKNNTPLYRQQEANDLTHFFVNKKELTKLLNTYESTQFTRLFSTSEVAKYLCMQPAKVNELANLFGWKKVSVTRSSVQFEATTIKEFVNNYIVLDKWCDTHCYPKQSLFRYLREHGLEPVWGTYTEKTKLHVFHRTPELFEVIQQFELDWFKTKTPRQLKLRNQQISAALMSQPTDKQFTNCPAI